LDLSFSINIVLHKKTQISNLAGTAGFWNNRHWVGSSQKIGKPNNEKDFGSKKTKLPNQDNTYRLRSSN